MFSLLSSFSAQEAVTLIAKRLDHKKPAVQYVALKVRVRVRVRVGVSN